MGLAPLELQHGACALVCVPLQAPAECPAATPEQSVPPKTNEATAQWRIYTDVGRELVSQASSLACYPKPKPET